MEIDPISKVLGNIEVPGDKSISHRALMFGALAKGDTIINNFLFADDTLRTLEALRNLGVQIKIQNKKVTVSGNGIRGFKEPDMELNMGNSGTSMRLLSGILSGQAFPTCLTGDASLSTRPMDRIITPLSMMGGNIISLLNDGCAPLLIRPSNLNGINYTSNVASAQIKSCVLLAGIYADKITSVTEPHKSRNHTEIMLESFGGDIVTTQLSSKYTAMLKPGFSLESREVFVPGDVSSAAPFIALATLVPNSELTIKNVGLNDTRTGFIRVLKEMGGNIDICDLKGDGEKFGTIKISSAKLKGVEIDEKIIPSMIDELPLVVLLSSLASGVTVIKGAKDLKNKECDRISVTTSELNKLGADITETNDGFIINGKSYLTGGEVSSFNDHRIAMMLTIACLVSKEKSTIHDVNCVNISYPEFFNTLKSIVY